MKTNEINDLFQVFNLAMAVRLKFLLLCRRQSYIFPQSK